MDLDDLRIPANRHGYIYLITVTRPTDGLVRYYVGQHLGKTFDKRYYGSGTILQNIYRKYGKKGYNQLLLWAYSQEELNFYEQLCIHTARIVYGRNCINLSYGGANGRAHASTRKKLSLIQRNRSPEQKALISARLTYSLTGKPKSPEATAKSAKTRTGMKRTEESKELMRLSHIGVPQGPHKQIECPHCGKVGGDRTMRRWHFDRCTVLTGVRVLPKGHGVNKTPHKQIKCTHCGKVGDDRQMHRWHFDNCPSLL